MLSQCHFFFFFNDTATTEIYTLSLHDALPIYPEAENVMTKSMSNHRWSLPVKLVAREAFLRNGNTDAAQEVLEDIKVRSEEHTSELQSRPHLVCRLLLEKKNKNAFSTMQPRKN